MANALYAKAKKAFCEGGINLSTDTIKAALVTSSYTPSIANDQFYSTPAANVVGTPQALTFTSDTAGQYKCGNPSFAGIASAMVAYLVIYKDTGTAGSSPLIALIDTATNLPYTAGSAVTLNVTFDPTNGVFTI